MTERDATFHASLFIGRAVEVLELAGMDRATIAAWLRRVAKTIEGGKVQ